MIPVAKVAKPRGFDTRVKVPGDAWLASHPMAPRPPALWAPYTAALSDGFDNLCGYAAMYDATGGTVDHFLSFKHHRDLAYERSNYRFACATLNSSKRDADSAVLDPFEVGAGWFEVILPSLQMRLDGELTLDGLRTVAPLLAAAVEAQGQVGP